MENKYAIQIKESGQWIGLSYHDEGDIIHVETFSQAYKFRHSSHAESFLKHNDIQKDDCELFKIKVFAEPIKWPTNED